MDLGVFKRSRVDFLAWILCPVLLIAALHFGTRSYCKHVNASVAWRRAFVDEMPDLDKRLSAAKASVDRFVEATQAHAESLETLSERLSALADGCGFSINEVAVNEWEGATSVDAGIVEVELEGEGRWLDIAQFMDLVQGPEGLVTIEMGRLRLVQQGRQARYKCELKLRFYDLTT